MVSGVVEKGGGSPASARGFSDAAQYAASRVVRSFSTDPIEMSSRTLARPGDPTLDSLTLRTSTGHVEERQVPEPEQALEAWETKPPSAAGPHSEQNGLQRGTAHGARLARCSPMTRPLIP
jgi:hypothetical protein